MAIIYSYPTVLPTTNDLLLGTDVDQASRPTKNFTVGSLITLITAGASGLGAIIKLNSSAADPISPFNNQSASNFLNISGTGSVTFNSFANGTMNITSGVGTGFTSFTSTSFTGKIDAGSFNQDNIRTLGILTNLKIGNATPAVTSIVTTLAKPGTDLALATTKAIVDYIENNPAASDSLAEVLNIGNQTTGATSIALVDGGTGYTPGVSVAATTVAPAGGTGLTVNINVNAGGVIGSISIATPGTSYANADVITITGGALGGLATANLTVVSNDIAVSASDDITFTDTSKIILGTGSDATIEHDGTDLKIVNTFGKTTISNSSEDIDITATAAGKKTNLSGKAGVELQFDTGKKLEVLDTGVTVTGITTSTGVFKGPNGTKTIPTYGFTSDATMGMYKSAFGITFSTNSLDRLTVKNAGIDVTGVTTTDSITTGTTTSSTAMTRFIFSTDGNGATPELFGVAGFPNNTMVPTTLAVKTYVDTVAGAKVLKYQADAAATGTMPFSLNLSTDSLDVAGGLNINTNTLDVTAAKLGVITINLDDNVSLPTAAAAKGVFTGKKYADAIMNIEAGVGSSFKSITTSFRDAAGNAFGFFGPLRANASSTNYAAGVADKAVELVSQGTASVGNDIQVYPTFSLSTNEVVAANATAIVLASIPVNNQTPIIGQALTGTSVVANTLITNVQINTPTGKVTLTVDKQQTAGITVNTALTFTTSAPIYTSGGPIVIPTFLPNTTATSKLLTGLVNGSATPILNTDSILGGMQNLQAQITGIPQGLVYKGTWNADTNNPTLASGVGTSGEFYIVSDAGATNLDGITDWLVGDWAIFVEVGATDTWQKIDNTSEITGGGGSAGDIALFTSAQNIAPSVINQTGSAGSFKVTLGSNSDFTVTGDTQLGDADTDTTQVKGPLSASKTIVLSEGFGVPLSDGATPPVFSTNYGTAGQVLTSGGSGGSSANIWTTPTVGEVVSVTGLYGITVAGTTAVPTIAVTSDANNLIKLATAKATPVGADTILINDSAATNVLKQVTLTSIKTFTAESWILSDGTNTTTISNGGTAKFQAAGTGIAVGESGGTVTITGSENPGTGTALTLPVWEAGGATLGDSMVSQDAAVGTKLTIASVTPALIINDTTANKGDLKISRSLDATTYESSGITLGSGTYGTHVFSQTDGSTPRIMLTLDPSNNAKFEGDVRLITDDAKFWSVSSATGGTKYVRLYAGSGTGQWDIYSNGANLKIKNNLAGDVSSVLAVDTGATFGRSINITGDGSFTGGLTTTDGTLVGTNSLQVSAQGGILYLDSSSGASTVMRTNGGITALTIDNGQDATFEENVLIKGNLTVNGAIIHGGGSGTHIAKGGTFTKLYTTGDIGVSGIAFTIERATSGSMVFDVMLTSDNGNSVSIAKKFTVASKLGVQAPIFNKIVDTGPDTVSDFAVAFAADGSSPTRIKCTITPAGMDEQKIGITIDLGFGQNNATVVMNA